jgi:hypothetical protein
LDTHCVIAVVNEEADGPYVDRLVELARQGEIAIARTSGFEADQRTAAPDRRRANLEYLSQTPVVKVPGPLRLGDDYEFCRVIRFKTESNRRGTGFLFDHSEGLALITAAHLCNGDREELLEFQQAWADAAPVTAYLDRIGSLDSTGDVAAFEVPQNLWPQWFVGKVPLTSDGLVYGQDCYILGYPFDLSSAVGIQVKGHGLPIIKKGIISGSSADNDIWTWYIDVHANPGFSGGPLVIERSGSARDFQIAGVTIGASFAPLDEPSNLNPSPMPFPAGLSGCVDVKHVLNLGLQS